MARQRRLIQIARRILPLTGKGYSSPTDWEKKKDQANKLIYQKHGIPNAVQLGHTLAVQTTLGGKDRGLSGNLVAWPGLPSLSPVGISRGGIIEICSPGQHCRDVAAQMALAEASSRSGSVLWMSVGIRAGRFGMSTFQEVPNLTLRHRAIDCAADSKNILQELLWMVRQQTYSMVVLDHIAGLAPPLPCWSTAFPPAHAATAAVVTSVSGLSAVAHPRAQFGAATAALDAVTAAATAAAGVHCVQDQQQQHHVVFDSHGHPGGGLHATDTDGGAVTLNLKFLYNVLPVLLEEALGDLACSCGPQLQTTVLLVNEYNWRERDRASWGSGLVADGARRSRWGRRAILRHASASLHVQPEVAEGATATMGAGPGLEASLPVRCLRAVLTQGGDEPGEDSEPLRTWSLSTPVRLAPSPLPPPFSDPT